MYPRQNIGINTNFNSVQTSLGTIFAKYTPSLPCSAMLDANASLQGQPQESLSRLAHDAVHATAGAVQQQLPYSLDSSHFGAVALQRSVSMLSDWVMSSLSWVEVSEPGALGGLAGALEELKHASHLLASLPGG